jgi:O-antigen ligase/polysaccharide polymerase Wzy-like membrane protein
LREHWPTALVALGVLALALPNGGYSAGVYAGLTVAVWGAVLIVLAFRFGPRDWVPTTAIVAGAALAGFAVLSLFSISWAEDAGRAYAEAIRAAGYAGLFVLVVLLARRGEAGSWLTGIAIGLAAVAVLAIAGRTLPSLPGGDEQISTDIPIAAGRLSWPIGYWNGLAAAMAMGLVLFSWLGASARTREARALAIGAMPICALVIYLASSRGGAVAAAIGLAVLFALGRDRLQQLAGLAIAGVGAGLLILFASTRDEFVNGAPGAAAGQGHEVLVAAVLLVAAVIAGRWLVDAQIGEWTLSPDSTRVALIAGGVVLLIALIALNPPRRLDEFNDPPNDTGPPSALSAHNTSSSGEGRYQFWTTALDAFDEQPTRGIGAGGYETYWNEHGSIPRSTRNPHSLVFQSMAELGLLGLTLIVLFFGAAAVGAYRRPPGDDLARQSAAAIAVVSAGAFSAAIDWIWQLPAVFGPVVIAVALLASRSLQDDRTPVGTPRRTWGIATAVAGVLAMFAAGILLLSEVRLDSSRGAAGDGDLSAAISDARDAAAIEPWSAEPRLQLALVDEQAGNLSAAHRRILEAIDRSPDDWRLWFTRARIEARSGNAEGASASLARARALNPRSPLFTQLAAE